MKVITTEKKPINEGALEQIENACGVMLSVEYSGGAKTFSLISKNSKIIICHDGTCMLEIPKDKIFVFCSIILSEIAPYWRRLLKRESIKMDKHKKIFKSSAELQSFIALVNIYAEIYKGENLMEEFCMLSKYEKNLFDGKHNRISILSKKDLKLIPNKEILKELFKDDGINKCIYNGEKWK